MDEGVADMIIDLFEKPLLKGVDSIKQLNKMLNNFNKF